MNHLVVYAHPNPGSFCKGIVDTIQHTGEAKGDAVRIRDLYALGFDAILKPADFEAFQSGKVPEDIKTEQEHIKWADLITFVYPVWWANMPAILKGYVDRVFSHGFGYQYTDNGPIGLLKGKKGLMFCTTGSPSEPYAQSGMHNSMRQTTDSSIFVFCGIEVVDHIFFGAVPYVPEETRKEYLQEVARKISETR